MIYQSLIADDYKVTQIGGPNHDAADRLIQASEPVNSWVGVFPNKEGAIYLDGEQSPESN